MKQFIIGTTEYSMKTEWNELTMDDFIQIEQHKLNKTLYEYDELWSLRLFEILSGAGENELDNIKLATLGELANSINFIKEPIPTKLNQYIDIDGEMWAFPPSLNDITMGEYISIKTLQENSNESEAETIVNLLSIILRPAKKLENGDVEIEPFNPKKVNERIEKIKGGKCVNLLGYANFFLSGKEISTELNTKNSLEEEQKQTDHQ